MTMEEKAKRFDEEVAKMSEAQKAVLMKRIEEVTELEKEEDKIIGHSRTYAMENIIYSALESRAQEIKKYIKQQSDFNGYLKTTKANIESNKQ